MGDVKIQRGGTNKKVKAQGFKPTQEISLYLNNNNNVVHFGLVKFPQKHTHTYTRLTPQPLKDDDKTNQSRALGQLNSVTTSSSATSSSRSKQRPIREKESAGA